MAGGFGDEGTVVAEAMKKARFVAWQSDQYIQFRQAEVAKVLVLVGLLQHWRTSVVGAKESAKLWHRTAEEDVLFSLCRKGAVLVFLFAFASAVVDLVTVERQGFSVRSSVF